MTEAEARTVLLVRALEEADDRCELLPPEERVRATEKAALDSGGSAAGSGDAPAGALGEIVVRRAERLLAAASSSVPGLERVARTRLGALRGGWLLWGVAFVVGLGSNVFGPEKRINLLQLPLLGLIVWNLVIYVLLLLRVALGVGRSGGRGVGRGGVTQGPLREQLADWARRGAGAVVSRVAGRGAGRDVRGGAGQTSVAAATYARYVHDWSGAAAPLLAARVARLLHGGALALMLGALAAMYARGIATEFSVTWESTFLDADQTTTLLRVVLAPALLIFGELPDLAALRAPAFGPAPVWLHLYAVTAIVYVVLPRAVLAWISGQIARRRSERFALDLEQPYFRRVLAPTRGGATRVDVLPYSYAPAAAARDGMATLLRDVFGSRAAVNSLEPIEYGTDPDDIVLPDLQEGEERRLVAVLSLSQTPEAEVHGQFLARLCEIRRGAGGRLLVLVDDTRFREHLPEGHEGADRLAARRAAWDAVAGGAGVKLVHLQLGRSIGDEALAAASEAVDGPGAR